MRQAEVIKVKKCVPGIINVLRVIGNRIGRWREGRNAMDVAPQAMSMRKQRRQTDGLAPKNANFQEASRLRLFKEQEPHYMKGILAETAAPARGIKILAVLSNGWGKLVAKITHAFQVKTGGVFGAFYPSWPVEASC